MQDASKAGRLDEALAFDDFGAVRREDDRRRPAIVLVAIRQIRTKILIDAQRHVVRRDLRSYVGIAVGFLVHDVAPVAPHRSDIEQNRLIFPLG